MSKFIDFLISTLTVIVSLVALLVVALFSLIAAVVLSPVALVLGVAEIITASNERREP